MYSDIRDEIIETIQQMYFVLICKCDPEKKKVNIYGVSSKSLAPYLTSDKDIIRSINRMPASDFLLNNTEGLEKDGELDDMDMDDFDDFVVIDKEDLRAKLFEDLNKNPEKLQKEQDMMSRGRSSTVMDLRKHKDKDVSDDRETCLDDFKIKKVIDKGSFGKVFLVVNTRDGEEYAMKRINKDILIEKGQILNTRTEKDILI